MPTFPSIRSNSHHRSCPSSLGLTHFILIPLPVLVFIIPLLLLSLLKNRIPHPRETSQPCQRPGQVVTRRVQLQLLELPPSPARRRLRNFRYPLRQPLWPSLALLLLLMAMVWPSVSMLLLLVRLPLPLPFPIRTSRTERLGEHPYGLGVYLGRGEGGLEGEEV